MDMKTLIPLVTTISMLMIVASVGLRAQWRDVAVAFQQSGLIWRGIVAVNLVVPLTAAVLCWALPIEPAIKTGIVIMAVSPLAPLMTSKVVKAGVEASFAVGLYVALVLLAVLIVPATIALLSAIFPPDATISVRAVAELTAKSVLVPLAAGLTIGMLAPKIAQPLAKLMTILGYIGVGLAGVVIVYAKAGDVMSLVGNGAILAIAITVIAGIAAGHFLASPNPDNQLTLGVAAAMRHPGLAAMIAQANFTDSRTALAPMLFMLTSTIVSTGYMQWMKRRPQAPAGAVAV